MSPPMDRGSLVEQKMRDLLGVIRDFLPDWGESKWLMSGTPAKDTAVVRERIVALLAESAEPRGAADEMARLQTEPASIHGTGDLAAQNAALPAELADHDADYPDKTEVARLQSLDAEMARAHNANLLEMGDLRAEVARLQSELAHLREDVLKDERDELRHAVDVENDLRALVGRMREELRTATRWISAEEEYTGNEEVAWRARADVLLEDRERAVVPIPMILHCPSCGGQHIDGPEAERGWTNPPHRSHLCKWCGVVWRPADVETVGVSLINTRGAGDTFTPEGGHPASQRDEGTEVAALRAALRAALGAAQDIGDSFWAALKPLQLAMISVADPGVHVHELIDLLVRAEWGANPEWGPTPPGERVCPWCPWCLGLRTTDRAVVPGEEPFAAGHRRTCRWVAMVGAVAYGTGRPAPTIPEAGETSTPAVRVPGWAPAWLETAFQIERWGERYCRVCGTVASGHHPDCPVPGWTDLVRRMGTALRLGANDRTGWETALDAYARGPEVAAARGPEVAAARVPPPEAPF